MNEWIGTVPEHCMHSYHSSKFCAIVKHCDFSVRWDPNREDPMFFFQSAFLHIAFYHLQILIHRPFIPTPRKPSPTPFPSLAICTNAARSGARIIDAHTRRNELSVPIPAVYWLVRKRYVVLNVLFLKRFFYRWGHSQLESFYYSIYGAQNARVSLLILIKISRTSQNAWLL